jgi:hypothetical protein
VPDFPIYYSLDALKPGDPDTYFRIQSGGRYERYDPRTKTWQHVTSDVARDYMSRAIENGDAWPVGASGVPDSGEVEGHER